jgi:1-phosphofructokinase
LLTVTIERKGDGDDVHVHAGGQGFWIARMMAALDVSVTLCGCFGGETGYVVQTLIQREGVALRPVTADAANAAYVHDRRSGARAPLAEMTPPALSRHDVDELYGAALVEGLSSSVCVLSGSPARVLPDDTYRRLAHDLGANGKPVVADLSGTQLQAALEGGLTVLKVSHTELLDAGLATSDSEEDVLHAMSELRARGAQVVVVSRAEEAALALVDEAIVRVDTPKLEPLDHRGAGDSMTAGIAAGLARGFSVESAICLGAAAGALNVTRRGLASGERDAIEQLAERVRLRPLGADRAAPSTELRTTSPDELAAKARPTA